MKSKIEQYAKGNFVYEHPEIILSETEITFVVEAGRTYTGTFTITNDKKTLLKGVLYTNHQKIKVQEKQFIGIENIIHYEIDATTLEAGESIDGTIDIVSDCGEAAITCRGQVVPQTLNTPAGPMKGWSQFAEYAKNDWNGAKKVFTSPEFALSPLLDNQESREIYQGLEKSSSSSSAFEEFLIAIHRKQPVRFHVSADSFTYDAVSEPFLEKIVITKDLWGYSELKIRTDAAFIELDRNEINTDDFIGNQYSLEFKVCPERLARGGNVAHIYIETPIQLHVITVTCNQSALLTQEMINHHKVKEYKAKLTKLYLGFRLKNISIEQYVTESEELVNSCLSIAPSDEMQLLRIHLAMIGHEDLKANQMLSSYERKLEDLREKAPVLYCGVYYLRALQYKDETTIQKACDEIREIYEQGHEDFMIFWFLIYLDKYYLGEKKRLLEDLKHQFEKGCTSPILYYEAANIYCEDPGLIYGLDKFESQVMRFALKNEMFTEEIANHYAYLAIKEKYFSHLVFHTLEQLYQKFESKDLLTAICGMLIKGHLRSNKYFKWFKLGVEAQLRVTELHEYYMYSIDEYSEEELPQQILLYFIYNSSLNDKKRAYLYARIIQGKERNPSIYHTYAKKIEQFAKRQLEAGAVNENLAVLYQDLVDEGQITEDLYNAIARVAYKAEVVCNHPWIKGVVAVCPEVEGEEYVAFQNGKALVTLKTPNAKIYLVDEKDQRCYQSIEYRIRYILRQDELLRRIMQWSKESLYQQIGLLVAEGAYRGFNEAGILLCKQCLELEAVKSDYRNRIKEQMIYYYQENQQFDALEYYLRDLDFDALSHKSKDRILDLCIQQETFDLAFQMIERYGFERLGISKLLKLFLRCMETCGKQIQEVAFSQPQLGYYQESSEEDREEVAFAQEPPRVMVSERLIYQMAVYLFQNGRRDRQVLEVLVKQYEGPNHTAYRIWQSARKDEIKSHLIEEQILVQSMFSNQAVQSQESVFLSYYQYAPKSKVSKAYLNCCACDYLMRDTEIPREVMDCMLQELTVTENDLCMTAILKHLADDKEELSKEEKTLATDLLERAATKNLILKDYQKFEGKVTLPNVMRHKHLVEYRTNPGHRVTLSYRVLDGKEPKAEFKIEILQPSILGIFSRNFLVFHGESIEYYFTEEDGKESKKTETKVLSCEFDLEKESSNYSKINQMLRLYEERKADALAEKMEEFIKNDYIRNHYFKNL